VTVLANVGSRPAGGFDKLNHRATVLNGLISHVPGTARQ